MTAGTDALIQAFRLWVTDNVPASGANWPNKAEIIAALQRLAVDIGAAQAGLHTEPTIAARDTYYATPENRANLVYVNNNNGSATDPANGVYEYVSGAARLAQGFYAGVAAVVQPLVDQAQGYANAAAASAAAAASGLTSVEAIGRAVTPVTGTALNAGTYVFSTPAQHSGTIRKVRAFGLVGTGSHTIKVRRWLKSGDVFTQTGSDTNVVIPEGANEVVVAIPINAGERIGFYTPASAITSTTTTSDSGGIYSIASDSTSFTDATVTTTVRMEIGFDLEFQSVTASRIDAMDAKLETASGNASSAKGITDLLTKNVTVGRSATPVTGSNNQAVTYVFADPLTADGLLDTVSLFGKTAGTVKIRRFNKAGDVFTQVGSDLVLTIGIGAQTVTSSAIGIWPVKSGERLGFFAAAGVLSFTSETSDSGGFYASTGDDTTFTDATVSTTARLQVGFGIKALAATAADPATVDLLAAPYQTISASGLNVTVSGTFRRNGQSDAYGATIAMPAAASGQQRVDLIVLDRTTLAVSRVAGSSRTANLDAAEWQGATPANSIIIGRALVSDTAAVVVNCTLFRGMIKTGREGEFSAIVQNNRRAIRKTLGKASRGLALKSGGYGDSLTAIQDTTIMPAAPARYDANGAWRDRRDYYFTSYPTDSRNLIPLYTAVQLGRPDDGAGAVHTRMGWNWAIRDGLLAAGAASVLYNNYGIGGTTSQATGDNGLLPARIAVPLADGLDLVVIAFGMNERGQTYTYANIVNMIGQFQAVGTECIVMGTPRPYADQSVTAWRYTQDALEAAAMDTGSAYISTAMMADDRNLGGIGIPAEILASTNILTGGKNHPGYFEHRQYERAAIAQLGL